MRRRLETNSSGRVHGVPRVRLEAGLSITKTSGLIGEPCWNDVKLHMADFGQGSEDPWKLRDPRKTIFLHKTSVFLTFCASSEACILNDYVTMSVRIKKVCFCWNLFCGLTGK